MKSHYVLHRFAARKIAVALLVIPLDRPEGAAAVAAIYRSLRANTNYDKRELRTRRLLRELEGRPCKRSRETARKHALAAGDVRLLLAASR